MKKKIIIGIIIIVVVVGGILLYWNSKKNVKPNYQLFTIERKDLIQTVSVTGQVKPAEDVELAFEIGGKVSNIHADVGDKVTKDQIIAELRSSDIAAQLSQSLAGAESARASLEQYQAALAGQEAKLSEYRRGTRLEEIQQAETNVLNANKALSDAQLSLANVKAKADSDLNSIYVKAKDIIADAYTKADDAVRNQTNAVFSNDETPSPYLTFSVSNISYKNNAELGRVAARDALNRMNSYITNLTTKPADIDQALNNVENELNIIKSFLISANLAVTNSLDLTDTTASSYKTAIGLGQTNVNTANSNITTEENAISTQKATNQSYTTTAETAVNSAQSALNSANDTLALKRAGYTPEQIASQEAVVKQAESNVKTQEAQIKYALANVQNIQAQLAKTVIRSPIEGIVTEKNTKVGEIIPATKTVFKVISNAKFQIEANVPEVDIANIKVGDNASVTLDAYSSDSIFNAQVIKVDPAETIIDNVPTYKVTFEFAENNDLIKSGMTADLDIQTNKKDQVIVVPQRAVLKTDNKKIVRVLDNDKINYHEVEVKTGIRGTNGEIEVTEGLSEGQIIIISTSSTK